MELVPILSTIILVGTIATFILAVCAYILYKIRERRSRQRAESRPAAEPHRHAMMPSPMQAPALPGAMSQPAPASMYITPTMALPPQGAVVEVDEIREAPVPAGGWSQPPQFEQALATSPAYARPRNGDGHNTPTPRLAPPQYEPIPAPPRPARAPAAAPAAPAEPQQSSMFWEYTDEGFVPVDPHQSAAREDQRRHDEQRRQEERRRADEPHHRRDDDEDDADSAWL